MRNKLIVLFFCAAFFVVGYIAGSGPRKDSSSETLTDLVKDNETQQELASGNQTRTISIVVIEKEKEPAYSPEERQLLAGIQQSFYRQALDLLIDTISVSDLIPLTASISGFNADFLWEMQHPHIFAKNLISLYLQDCSDQGGYVDSFDPVWFAREGDDNNGTKPQFHSIFRLNRAVSRIYAHFTLPLEYDKDEVLVRWCNETTDKNILYGPYVINRFRSLNYVWWQPRSVQLEPGNYYVHIWTADQTPQLIAFGSYQMVE